MNTIEKDVITSDIQNRAHFATVTLPLAKDTTASAVLFYPVIDRELRSYWLKLTASQSASSWHLADKHPTTSCNTALNLTLLHHYYCMSLWNWTFRFGLHPLIFYISNWCKILAYKIYLYCSLIEISVFYIIGWVQKKMFNLNYRL